jgi:translocation and assembly module TamB
MHDPLAPSPAAAPAPLELRAEDRPLGPEPATPERPPSPPATPGWRRALRVLLGLLLGLILLLAGAALALWLWAGNPNSLAQLLHLAQRHIPAAQALQVSGVQGSLRQGGRIAQLRWQQPDGVSVAIDALELAWQPLALLRGSLQIDRLQAQRVQVVDRSPATEQTKPSSPLQQLTLPLQIHVDQLRLEHFGWDEPQSLRVDQLRASYHYNGQQHALSIGHIALFDGVYTLKAALQARAPMTLQAQLDGRLQAPLPAGQPAWPLTLQASAPGPLQDFELQARAQAAAARPEASAATGTAVPPGQVLPTARLNARIQPWRAGLPLQQAHLTLQDFNLQAFQSSLPQTLLSGSLSVQPNPQQRLLLQADLRNQQPGPWDRQRLPLALLRLQGDWQDDASGRQARIEQLQLSSGDGSVSGTARLQLPPAPASAAGSDPAAGGSSAPWQAELDLQVQQLNPQALYSSLASAPLSGSLRARSRAPSAADPQAPLDFNIELQGQAPKRHSAQLWLQQLQAQGVWSSHQLELQQLRLSSNQARLQGHGLYQLQQQEARAQVQLSLPGASGQLDGRISAQQGQGTLALNLSRAEQTRDWLRQLPGLEQLLAGQQAHGAASLQAQWQGGWQRPTLNAQLDIAELALRDPQQAAGNELALHDSHASLRGGLDQATLQLQAQGRAAGLALQLDLSAQGGQQQVSGASARWQFSLDRLRARLQDPLHSRQSESGWWTLETLQAWSGSGQDQTLQTSAGAARLLAPESFASAGNDSRELPIRWQPIRLRTNSQGLAELRSAGEARGLPFAWANALSAGALSNHGITGDLRLDASWNIQLDRQLQARLALERSSGDITLRSEDASNGALALAADQVETPAGRGSTKITLINPQGSNSSNSAGTPASRGPRITAGIRTLSLVAKASSQQLQAELNWDSERLGHAHAELSSPLKRLNGAWVWAADAPLSGLLQAEFSRLGIWSVLAPPGWRMRGQLAVDTRIGGRRDAPELSGSLRGSELALYSVLDGVALSKGEFLANLQGNRMQLERFSIQGEGGGALSAQGQLDWRGSQPEMRITADIQKLMVSRRADRQVMVSGQLQSTLSGQQLALDGKLGIDRARILLPESSAPTLGDDVHIVDPAQAEAQAAVASGQNAITPRINVSLDLGRDFTLKGYGINTELRGLLKASSPDSGSAIPRINGDITTVNGEYRAYGQWLDIEHGIIRFAGPYDNPALDILAIRPRLTERVGVQISGPAVSPVIRLYSASSMTDSEKLAWLLLGRSGSAGGAESAMLQQAAAAMLSGGSDGPGIAGTFGLDQLSVGGSQNADGETEASVTVGKQLARDLYVTYERSLSGALGTLYVFYDLSKRWTLRGESGEENALDLIFTLPYD